MPFNINVTVTWTAALSQTRHDTVCLACEEQEPVKATHRLDVTSHVKGAKHPPLKGVLFGCYTHMKEAQEAIQAGGDV